ncbi:44223_t:CDS:2, partial [Gigaspora margarita]
NEQHLKPRPSSKEDAEPLTEITVVINEEEVLVLKLNVKNKLNKIREKFESYEEIEMANNVNFTKNGVMINITNDEKTFELKEILVGNKVYLKRKKKPSWRDLVRKFKLEYGRNYEENKDKVANKKAFIIKDCEFDVFTSDEYCYDDVTISSTDELIQNKSLFLKAQIELEILSATKLGLSIESAKNSQDHSETALKFYARNFGKAKISFQKQNVVLTQDFKNEVQKAIDSRDPKKIYKIIAEFGQFIPTTIQFGGRLYYEDTTNTTKNSANKNIEGSANLSIYGQGLEFQHKSGISNKSGSTMQHKGSFIFGGDKIKIYESKEAEWVTSLQDFRYWEPIEFCEPVSILEFLEEDLIKKIKEIIGKRIIYSKVQDYSYKINNLNYHIANLEMPGDVQTIFSDSEIDSQVFATILNMDENDDIFTYTLYTPERSKVPKVIINCISNNKKLRECHIKIRWMVVGYDPNINSALLSSVFCLQSAKKEMPAPSNNEHIFKMTEDNPLVACGIPVVSELKTGHEHLVIGYHFSFCKTAEKLMHVFMDMIYAKRKEVDRKKKSQKLFKKNKMHETDNKLPEFVSLYVNKVGECQQCIPEFIAKKLERFILEQPECKKAIKEKLRFVTVFNPEAAK